jgi:hypothetical protein
MNQSFYGSICLTDLLEAAKKKHSAFTKGKNGKIYANVTVWLNENKDKFGNIMSLQVNPIKDSSDDKFYIGNCKASEGPKPVSDKDVSGLDVNLDDLPVTGSGQAPNANNAADDDLPF